MEIQMPFLPGSLSEVSNGRNEFLTADFDIAIHSQVVRYLNANGTNIGIQRLPEEFKIFQ